MPLSSKDVTNAVAKRLKYYVEVERREDGFDLSPVEPSTAMELPLMVPGKLHDRSLKHYFSEPGVRVALQMGSHRGVSGGHSEPTYSQHTVSDGNRSHKSRTRLSNDVVSGERNARSRYKYRRNRAPHYWPEYASLYRRVPPPFVTRGELVRLVSSASRLIVSTEVVQLAPNEKESSRVKVRSQSKACTEKQISLPHIQDGGDTKKKEQNLWVKPGIGASGSHRMSSLRVGSANSNGEPHGGGGRHCTGANKKKVNSLGEGVETNKSRPDQRRKSENKDTYRTSQEEALNVSERDGGVGTVLGEQAKRKPARVALGTAFPLEAETEMSQTGSFQGDGEVRAKEVAEAEQDLRAEQKSRKGAKQESSVTENEQDSNEESGLALEQKAGVCSLVGANKEEGERPSSCVPKTGESPASCVALQTLPAVGMKSNVIEQPETPGSELGMEHGSIPTGCTCEDRVENRAAEVPQRQSLLRDCLAISGDTDSSSSRNSSSKSDSEDERNIEEPAPHLGQQGGEEASISPAEEEGQTKVTESNVPATHQLGCPQEHSKQSRDAQLGFGEPTPPLDQESTLQEKTEGVFSPDVLSPQGEQRQETPSREESNLNPQKPPEEQGEEGTGRRKVFPYISLRTPSTELRDEVNDSDRAGAVEHDLSLDEENFPPLSPTELFKRPSPMTSPRDTDTMVLLMADTRSVLSDVSDSDNLHNPA
ncbi:uncharacterized protein LOC136712805 [Amia ocellicauda]|uniref:uncharacterized protein LOC136712805 n=1 Tax=Amia ocellicauda TaxID=2972642 RepID=UPI0034643AA7